jgi:hypothetical protein
VGFDRLIDPSGRTALPDAPADLPQWTPTIGRLSHEVGVPPPQSRRTRRLQIVAGTAFVIGDIAASSALNLGSPLGQFMGGVAFGTVSYVLGHPAIEKAWRATKPRHQTQRRKRK